MTLHLTIERASTLIRSLALAVSTLALGLIAAPAANAGHPPQDSDPNTVPMPLSGGPALLPGLSFDCEDGMAGIYPCDGIDLKGTVTLPNLGGPAGNESCRGRHPAHGGHSRLRPVA